MTQRIRWNPATSPNIVAYQLLYTDGGATAPFTVRAEILNTPVGVNFDLETQTFFFDDDDAPGRLYRMNTLDAYGNTFSDLTVTPFEAGNDPVNVPVANVFPLDENTGGRNALGYISDGGTPIDEATIRVYTKLNWDLRRYNQVVGVTATNALGGWKSPIFVEPGNTFVVVYEKPNVFGPDTAEVVV